MLGTIVGDIIGSSYEGMSKVPTDFPLFFDTPSRYPPRPSKYTDDSILTCATAGAILDHGNPTPEQYATAYIKWFEKYADRNFWGSGFRAWAEAGQLTVRSAPTNGAAMRVAPIGWAFNNVDDVREAAKRSCHFTHNDPIATKSAVAVAEAVFLARTGQGKDAIKDLAEKTFGDDLHEEPRVLRSKKRHGSMAHCLASVPPAFKAFLDSTDFEDAVRRSIVIGGDTDTHAAIAGGIAEAFYGGVPKEIGDEAMRRLSLPRRKGQPLVVVVERWRERWGTAAQIA